MNVIRTPSLVSSFDLAAVFLSRITFNIVSLLRAKLSRATKREKLVRDERCIKFIRACSLFLLRVTVPRTISAIRSDLKKRKKNEEVNTVRLEHQEEKQCRLRSTKRNTVRVRR